MKIKMLAGTVVLTTELKLSDMSLVLRKKPEAAKLKNEKNDEIFRVTFNRYVTMPLTNYGVEFNTTTKNEDDEELVAVKFNVSEDATKHDVADMLSGGYHSIETVIAQIQEAAKDLTENIAALEETIEEL